MTLKPGVESACVEKRRRRDATLDVAIPDRKTAPFIFYVTSHAVRSVSPLADWDAPIEASGLPVPPTNNHVVLADGFPPRVRIFVQALGGNVYCPDYFLNHKEADKRIHQFLLSDDRAKARVKNQEVPRPESCDPRPPARAIVAISKVAEIWVEMHVPMAKAIRQTQIPLTPCFRKNLERGNDLIEGVDVGGRAFIPGPVRNWHVNKLSRHGINRRVPSTISVIDADANKDGFHESRCPQMPGFH